jgi:hypothetical protein
MVTSWKLDDWDGHWASTLRIIFSSNLFTEIVIAQDELMSGCERNLNDMYMETLDSFLVKKP